VKAKAHVVHSVPGRVRLRVHNRRRDQQFFEEVESRLARLSQVKSVETDPLTGSVLVHHSGPAFELLLAAAEAGLGQLLDFEPPAPVARQIRDEVALLDQIVRRTSDGQLDLSTVAMFGLFALAGIQLVQGSQPVIAVTLAWYASELLRRWEEPSAVKTS
jgi:hypothetical protein